MAGKHIFTFVRNINNFTYTIQINALGANATVKWYIPITTFQNKIHINSPHDPGQNKIQWVKPFSVKLLQQNICHNEATNEKEVVYDRFPTMHKC